MLHSIAITDSPLTRPIELRPGSLTALVGENGSGKSTFMKIVNKGLDLVSSVACHHTEFRNYTMQNVGVNFNPTVALRYCSESDSANHLCANGTLAGPGTFSFSRSSHRSAEIPVPANDLFRQFKAFDGVTTVRHFEFEPASIRKRTMVGADPYLGLRNGEGLPLLLLDLKMQDDPRFDSFIALCKMIIPGLKNVVPFIPRNENHATLRLHHEWGQVELENISDGTAIALAITCAVQVFGKGNSLILLDDCERGLHPKAQMELAAVLRKLVEAERGLQIMISTHSPFMIRDINPDDVWMFAVDKGGTKTRRLSSVPDFARLSSVMNPGEIWTAIGERWVLGDEQ